MFIFKNHIWNCEYQEKNLEWVIKKHKYIELNHKKQIKLLERMYFYILLVFFILKQ